MSPVLISKHAMERIERLSSGDQEIVMNAIEDLKEKRFFKVRALLRGDSVVEGNSFVLKLARNLRIIYKIEEEQNVILIVTVFSKNEA